MISTATYEVCLPNWPAVLPDLAELIGADSLLESFLAAESAFQSSGEDVSTWSVHGRNRCSVSVRFELHEGYLFGNVAGHGKAYARAAERLWLEYLNQGGDPDAQQPPP